MVTDVIWTKTADGKFDEMLDYLVKQGAPMAASKLVKTLWEKIERLKKFPEMGRLSKKAKTVRYVKFYHFKYVYYRVEGRRLMICNFFDARQDPDKKPYS